MDRGTLRRRHAFYNRRTSGHKTTPSVPPVVPPVVAPPVVVDAPSRPQPADIAERTCSHVYIANWGWDAEIPRAKQLSQMDVVINAFWGIDTRGAVTGRNQDQEKALAGLGPPILAAIGGWGGCSVFSSVFQSQEIRKSAVCAVGEAVKEAGWQGIDIDWEFPETEADEKGLRDFITEYHQAWPIHMISVALSSEVRPGSLPLPAAVDWFHVMTYDFCGNWSTKSEEASGLSQGLASLKAYVSAGLPARKLFLGSAWYGKSCIITGRISSPGGIASAWTDEPYSGIVQMVAQPGWTVTTLPNTNSTWAFFPYHQLAISYEAPDVVAAKVKAAKGYGGIMCWEWTQDTAQGSLASAFLVT